MSSPRSDLSQTTVLDVKNLIVPDWPAPSRVKALFTTRAGGVSGGAFGSLNLGAHVGDAAIDVLASMKSLKLVNIYHTLISEEAHGRLVKALPQTRIVWDRDSKLPNRRGS